MLAVAPLPSRRVALDGAAVVTGGQALALLGLAAVAALPATRTWGRQVVGALVALAGVGLVVVVVRALVDPAGVAPVAADVPAGEGLGPWPYAALVGGLLLAASGGLVLVRGRRWVAMGARYEAPAAEAPLSEGDTWAALDRGEDPTASGQ